MVKTFKQFINDLKSKSKNIEQTNYSEMSYKKLIKIFNREYCTEEALSSAVNSLGSILVFRSHAKVKREKNIDKKINHLANIILAAVVAIMSRKE